MLVRPARAGDLAAIDRLYTHYILGHHATFDVEPWDPERRQRWFEGFAEEGPYRLLVAVRGDDVLGYAASHRHRDKEAYRTSVETSVYLAPEATGQGVGTLLYDALFDAIAGEDLHRAFAGVALPNPASIALHERVGFRHVGTFTEQGYKFGRYWDVAWFEKPLPA